MREYKKNMCDKIIDVRNLNNEYLYAHKVRVCKLCEQSSYCKEAKDTIVKFDSFYEKESR